ncbi:MAG: DUF3341 domain-containing protein [Oligoflexus sp.]
MKKRPGGILAVFRYLDDLTEAMEKARKRGDFDGHEVYSPTSYHEIEHAAGYGDSGVRWFTFTGAMTGTVTGFALALLTDWDWPLVVGGKTAGIASLPAYIILGFEWTILLGGIATVIGMLVMGRIPNPKQRILDIRFTDDRFGIFVPNAALDGEQAKILQQCGAEEIREIQAT